jgi:hypothetical protein
VGIAVALIVNMKKQCVLCVVAAFGMVIFAGCNGSSNSPANNNPPPAQPGVVSSSPSPGLSWNNITQQNDCEAVNPGDCSGLYGFTIFNDGTYSVGPAPGAAAITGSVTAAQLSTINSDASAVASSGLNGTLTCSNPSSSSEISGVQQSINLTLAGASGSTLIYQAFIPNEGTGCYQGSQTDSLQLFNDMSTLTNIYYPIPYPSASPSGTPIANGEWGGSGAELQEAADGGTFQLGCAQASTDGPIVVNSTGSFSVQGRYYLTGGVIIEGDPRNYKATFTGTVINNVMNLTVSFAGANQQPQSFQYTLTFNQPATGVDGICAGIVQPGPSPSPSNS